MTYQNIDFSQKGLARFAPSISEKSLIFLQVILIVKTCMSSNVYYQAAKLQNNMNKITD